MEKRIKIYIDENLPPQFAQAFNIIQSHLNNQESIPIDVLSIKEEFGKGALDEDWIPVVGKQEGIVITQDLNIQHIRHQKELYNKSNVGVIFLKSPNSGLTFWEMFKRLVRLWDEIKHTVRKHKPPFAFIQRSKDKGLEQW
ncbi:MAG: hypothetical protein ACM3U1_05820 [Chloroflexota bacterium]